MSSTDEIRYRRSRFSTRLPTDRLYTRSHFWVKHDEAQESWQVGFTQFAIRMLGEFVEIRFQVQPGEAIAVGQVIGEIEGFKAVTEIYSVIAGTFQGVNPDLETDITLADTDPYQRGWLYRAAGTPEAEAVVGEGYVDVLDATIAKMTDKQAQGESDG
ncbi:glycine cleavage system protein H [Armatimonas rosea]|uniref:Glycine cleavage system H protein n=1 Tax=Armatimonas rosea TaxID=685828 RepID=A0A7W9SKZ0_ARMRO|nr:glycine cleavage system protein H [Armatimonas rosea]MBB6048546.1 glycine cleavage system H protein [Armatimonas rosea]